MAIYLGSQQIAGDIFKPKTADQSVATDTLTADDHLSFAAAANATYEITLGLVAGESSGDISAQVTVPAGATAYGGWVIADRSAGGYGGSLRPISGPVTTRRTVVSPSGAVVSSVTQFLVVTGSTAGAIALSFATAEEGAVLGTDGTATLLAGSWLSARRLS